MKSATNHTDVLNRNLFLVKEHTGLFKAANNYDVYDPDSHRPPGRGGAERTDEDSAHPP